MASATNLIPLPQHLASVVQLGTAEALQFVDIVTDFTINDEEDAVAAGAQLRAIARFRKEYEETRLAETRPYDDLKKRIMAEFSPALDKAGHAERLLRIELARWTTEQELLAAERRRRNEAELQRERQEAAAALRREEERAASLKTPAAQEKAAERVESLRARVDEADVAPTAMVHAAPKVAGFGMRDNWQAEYGDIALLVAAAAKDPRYLRYLAFETKVIGQTVKAMREATDIPGVRAVNNRTTAVR